MKTFWDKIKKGVDEGAAYLSEKTEQFTRIGKLKMDILGLKRKIEAKFARLGEYVFQLIVQEESKSKNIADDEEIMKMVEEINNLQKQLDEKNEELEMVSKSKRPEATSEQSVAE
ncbi:hypothetical protein DRQ15_02420 [candidate division KSB1 bacterium]|nr:MAG: hypothetical protein B5M50_02840 [candidate division KSB1 bacterium 4484_219]RKY80665.1 MAG: hypothetical protein DRQ00_01660 [candidate division KSB1 bacterium]RKY86027.1 MAG: hypothetical protein DRP98_01445 [candidate division KSB1 bacterium]RKY87751.1 MAG: hypothetical protein DRQ11_05420 [candidate division KSB1 bacterium]RKY92412.1 MAG: hypothetical protein DRQ15_02420 [candidate division KSB1 bacterium]